MQGRRGGASHLPGMTMNPLGDARGEFGSELSKFLEEKVPGITGEALAELVVKHSVLTDRGPSRSTVERIRDGKDSPSYTQALRIVDAAVRVEIGRLGSRAMSDQQKDQEAFAAVATWLSRWIALGLPVKGCPEPSAPEEINAWLIRWKGSKHPPTQWPDFRLAEAGVIADNEPGPQLENTSEQQIADSEADTAPVTEPSSDTAESASEDQSAQEPGMATAAPAPGAVPEFGSQDDGAGKPGTDRPFRRRPSRRPRARVTLGTAAAAVLVLVLGVTLPGMLRHADGRASHNLATPAGTPGTATTTQAASGSPGTRTSASPSSATTSLPVAPPTAGATDSSLPPPATPAAGSTDSVPSVTTNVTGSQPTSRGSTGHPSPTTPTPAPSQSTAGSDTKIYSATVSWTDDGAPGGTDLIVYNSPNKGHAQSGAFKKGDSLQVVCETTSNDSITVGPAYSNPNPPPSNLWYEITYNNAWAPAVYVDTHGASIPTCH